MKKKILIVDDTVSLAENVADILKMEGFEVILAKNGSEGLKSVMEEKPELIITDVVMPDIDGFEFITRLRANTAFGHIPVIILSAGAREEDVVHGKNIGAEMYLTKPCDIDLLIKSVNNLLLKA